MSTATITTGRAPRFSLAARYGASVPQVAAMIVVAVFLLAFLVIPIVRVFMVAFTHPEGGFSLVHFGDFFRTRLLREAFWNSLYVAGMTVAVASLIAVPLATILSRFRFRGAALIHTLGVVPLVMPPFVGAVAMQLIYGRNGTINLLMMDWFGFRIPFAEAPQGYFCRSIALFPFILLNLSASLANIDSAMEVGTEFGARIHAVLAHCISARTARLCRRGPWFSSRSLTTSRLRCRSTSTTCSRRRPT